MTAKKKVQRNKLKANKPTVKSLEQIVVNQRTYIRQLEESQIEMQQRLHAPSSHAAQLTTEICEGKVILGERMEASMSSAIQRRSIALEALGLVYGEREADYGPVISCFDRTANIMNAIRDKTDVNKYTGKQVALIMMAMKLARRQFHYKRDNNVDLIGYTDLLEVFDATEPLK